MTLFTEIDNPAGTAGTVIAAGTNPDIDAAFKAGDPSLAGVTINAQGNYEVDGVELTSAGGTTKVLDESKLADYADEISAAADLKYLSQNTGVNTADMNAAYESLGIDPNSTTAHADLNKILEASGYNPGEQVNFFGNNTPNDIGAKLLSEKWQTAPTPNDIEAAGLDPSKVTVINSNAANAFWLEQTMRDLGYKYSDTKGLFGSRAGFGGGDLGPFGSAGATSVADMDDIRAMFGDEEFTENTLDMLEWDLTPKKKPLTTTPGTSGSSPTANINTGISGAPGAGINQSGMVTGGAPNFVSTPNFGNVTPIYGSGQTGTSEVDIPTYEAGLGLQQTQFADRAAEQAKLYQPQTEAEKTAAGSPTGFENVPYRNRFGMTMYIQHINGVPSQPIPPGYYKVEGFNEGGVAQGFNPGGAVNPAMNFKPGGTVVEEDGKFRIKYPDGTYSQDYGSAVNAKAALDMGTANLGLPSYGTYLQDQGVDMNLPGYDQDAYYNAYQAYIADPTTLQNIQDQQAAKEKEALPPETGDINKAQPTAQTEVTAADLSQAQRDLVAQSTVAPGGAVAASPVSYIDPNVYGSVVESTAGQALGTAPMVQEDQVAQIGSVTTADTPQKIGAGQVTAQQAYSDVQNAAAAMDAAQLGAPTKTIDAAQQIGTSVSGLEEAQGTSIDVTKPDERTVETIDGTSEIITGTGVDQSKVDTAFGTGEVQAASVQNELANLMAQFDDGQTPAWAAGSMRAAMATLSARGLAASSLAGQAVIQAAMEAALPIAQIDAANKQQTALFKAEQRAKFLQIDFDQAFQTKVVNAAKISEIANVNFTAEQQIALENSKAANTMELQNLTNEQALIMAEAAALSQLDTQNLNNRQQAAVQNAQNFLQVDMANLSNEQQTALFKQQSLINSILSDQAAANAAQQFNATSENQTNQFFANLAASVNQFNAAQMNAMKQFNADEVNSLLEFNSNIQNQREMFNAQNYLVVAQANAQWRQNLATINTAAANESNMEYAQTVNALTLKTLDEIWQRERDIMDYSFTSSENAADRALSILLGDKKLDALRLELDANEQQALGSLMTKIFFSSDLKSIFS